MEDRESTPRAVMWTVSQVAERDGVSRQAVSRKARDLAERHGLSVERDPRGNITRFNVAEYDHLRGRYSDPSKSQAPRRAEPVEATNRESYDEALRQKTWHDAERARLHVEELKGDLVRVADVADAVGHCGIEINRVVDRIINDADDIAAATARDGVHGCRTLMKSIAVRLRGEIAASLESLVRVTHNDETIGSDSGEMPTT